MDGEGVDSSLSTIRGGKHLLSAPDLKFVLTPTALRVKKPAENSHEIKK
jgi:hypothetical protein